MKCLAQTGVFSMTVYILSSYTANYVAMSVYVRTCTHMYTCSNVWMLII